MNRFIIMVLLGSLLSLLTSCRSKEDMVKEGDKVIVRSQTMTTENLTLSDSYSFDELKERYDLTLLKDEETGYIIMEGSFDDIQIQNNSDSLTVLSQFQQILQIDSLTFACKIESVENDGTVYNMIQMYQDIPVYQYGFRLLTDQDGKLLSIEGRYAEDISCRAENAISPREVRKVINKDIEIHSYELMIYRKDSGISIPIWYLDVSKGEKPGYILFNAVSRTILECTDFSE
jgi:Zn-dependent metalloprotease